MKYFGIPSFLNVSIIAVLLVLFWYVLPSEYIRAQNVQEYKDTITDSAPNQYSNHSFSFVVTSDVPAGGMFEFIPPSGFEITSDSSVFSPLRNVAMAVDGTLRTVGAVQGPAEDVVDIVSGSPGIIRYTLNTTQSISAGSRVEVWVGNHTVLSQGFSEEFSTTTGTSTTLADIKPIKNAPSVGTHQFSMQIFDGSTRLAQAGFLIALVDAVGVGPADTRESVPPERFNGAPTGDLSGTTVSVELSVETNEFAICKYGTTANVAFAAMSNTFTSTGLIFHTQVVAVTPDSINNFYVRCIDDEGNINIDDYVIQFNVNPRPTGSSNTDGDVNGDGTGTGNSGGGSGSGGGGTSGSQDGEQPTQGGNSGGGGSGGGGGGGSGGSSGSGGGGSFESSDAPYRSGDGQVVVTGYAPPRSEVVVLVDGDIAKKATAGSSGAFEVTIDLIARGVYTFSVYANDANKVKTGTYSTSFTVAGARASALSNVQLPPSIKVSPDPVNPGQPLTISGYAIPNATVTIENEKDGSSVSRKQYTATSDGSGKWSVPIDTAAFSSGTYKVRAKAEQSLTLKTNFSGYTLYGVGQSANRPLNTDLNRDGKVNLVDFSILLFWWNTNAGDSDPSADINADGKVNLTDFSILLFNWTG